MHLDGQHVVMKNVVGMYPRLKHLYARNCSIDWSGFDHCCELEQDSYWCLFPTFIADLTIEVDWQPVDFSLFSKIIYQHNNLDDCNEIDGNKYNGPILVLHCNQQQYANQCTLPWWL